MKNRKYYRLAIGRLLLACMLCGTVVGTVSCSDDDEPAVSAVATLKAVSNLTVESTMQEDELKVKFQNSSYLQTSHIQIAYREVEENTQSSTDASGEWKTVSLDGSDYALVVEYLLNVPKAGTYEVAVTLFGKSGERSETVSAVADTYNPDKIIAETSMLDCADKQMTNLFDKYFNKSSRTIWQTWYPNVMSGNGVYWDGDALVWGQGAALSAFIAVRYATEDISRGAFYSGYDDRIFNGIQGFWCYDDRNGVTAYSCYPAGGNDRFYDDNVWIGLDMAEWYKLTGNVRYLDQAKAVWNYLTEYGWDETCHGGVYWKELPVGSVSKNTCSTAPTGVLSCKLYEITKDPVYLEWGKKVYDWLMAYVQDPADHLFWDNVSPAENNPMEIGRIEKNKYAYNAGQPLQLACMLYKFTGEQAYLDKAQEIALACYNQWFINYHSTVLNKDFRILSPDDAWFHAVMSRGFFELYSIDNDPKYLNDLRYTMLEAWYGEARQPNGLINDNDLSGRGDPKTQWEIRQQAALIEMMARLAVWENEH